MAVKNKDTKSTTKKVQKSKKTQGSSKIDHSDEDMVDVAEQKEESEEDLDPAAKDSDDEEMDDESDVKTSRSKVKDSQKSIKASPTSKMNLGARNSRSVYVKRLKGKLTEEDITEFFSVAGKVINVRFIRSRGCAIVLFDKEKSVDKAIKLHKTKLKGRMVNVERMKPADKSKQQREGKNATESKPHGKGVSKKKSPKKATTKKAKAEKKQNK